MSLDSSTVGHRREEPYEVVWLRHNRVDLALHKLSDSIDPGTHPLLLLHGLGENATKVGSMGLEWNGQILSLDFTGHGISTRPRGGGYTSEILMGDVDAVLAEVGPVTILGRGLGAYVALLSAAARPDLVKGALLCDGPGLAGGGIQPGSPSLAFPYSLADPRADAGADVLADPLADGLDDERADGLTEPARPGQVQPTGAMASRSAVSAVPSGQPEPPDPFAMLELSRDVRPTDYAQNLLRLASDGTEMDPMFYICAVARPEWLDSLVNQPGVQIATIEDALRHLAATST